MEVWLASACSEEKVQLTDLRESVIKDWSSRSQAVLCDLLSGELGFDNLRYRGRAGHTKSCLAVCVGELALIHTCFCNKGEVGPLVQQISNES